MPVIREATTRGPGIKRDSANGKYATASSAQTFRWVQFSDDDCMVMMRALAAYANFTMLSSAQADAQRLSRRIMAVQTPR